MRALLVYPPRSTNVLGMGEDKLGLLYMAAVLRNNGIDVRVYDEGERNSFKGLKALLKEYRPTIVGISISTPNRFDGFKTARFIKQFDRKTVVIAGGPHVSAVPRDTLENIKDIDAVVMGEGEDTLLELCKIGVDIRGVAFRREGKIFINPPRENIRDLNNIPFPARDLLQRYKNKEKSKYYVNIKIPDNGIVKYFYPAITTGRGCPFNCVFCAVPEIWGRNVRFRSVEDVIAEIRHLKETFDVEGFQICDDTFNVTRKRVFDICNLILKEKLKVKWHSHIRVDNVDKEMLSLMKEAGCYMTSIGVESGSQRIIDEVIEKRITLDKVKKVVKWCDEVGIIRSCNFIYSLPEETREDIDKTMELMKELGGKQLFGPTIILPASRIEKIAKEKHILPDNFSWAKKSPYRYYDPTSNSRLPVFVDKLSWKEILDIFYTHITRQSTVRTKNYISRIVNQLFQIRSFADLKFLLRNYFDFLKIFYQKIFNKMKTRFQKKT